MLAKRKSIVFGNMFSQVFGKSKQQQQHLDQHLSYITVPITL